MSRILGLLLAAAGLLAACIPASASTDDLADAFAAAFGGPPPMVRLADRTTCLNDDCHLVRTTELRHMSVTPERLIALGKSRFALLALEKDQFAGHTEPGAVAITYLHHTGSFWRVERMWPEFAWTGSSGIAADRTWPLDRPGQPLLVLAKEFLNMDQDITTFWIILLGQQGPLLLGDMPGGGSLEDNSVQNCGPYGYAADLATPRHVTDLLSVRYIGWTAPRGHIRTRTRFSRKTDVAVSTGNLEPRPWILLPDCD